MNNHDVTVVRKSIVMQNPNRPKFKFIWRDEDPDYQRRETIRRQRELDEYNRDAELFYQEKAERETASASGLSISDPHDTSEQQADTIASQVVNNEAVSPIVPVSSGDVQPKQDSAVPPITPSFESKLNSTKGGGSSLDESTRTEMESKMGADFSETKIHTGNAAGELSQEINAKAFTHGQDIYFNSNQSPANKELLAHELVHAGQQGSGMVQRHIQREIWKPDIQYIQTWKQFQDYGISYFWNDLKSQLDWYNSPVFSFENDPDLRKRETIQEILLFLETYEHTTSLHRITIGNLIAQVNGKKVAELGPDEAFENDPQPTFNTLTEASALSRSGFFYIPNDLEKAKDAPAKYDLLKGGLKPDVFKLVDGSGLDALNTMADAQDLIDYSNLTVDTPVFQSDEDIIAFGKMNNATGTKAMAYRTLLAGRIRNVHRFHAETLDQLIINYGRTGIPEDKRDRLVVVLYAAYDATGPLVRDENVLELVKTNNDPLETDGSKKIMVLVVEGKEDISQYKGTFTDLAKTYGRWGRIDQFVIHAHGNTGGLAIGPQTIATDPSTGEQTIPGELSFRNNAEDTDIFFNEIKSAMKVNKNVPEEELVWKSRIVFAACLTNSDQITTTIAKGSKNPQKTIRKWLRENENFVARVSRKIRPGKNKQNVEAVIGSNAVTTASTGMVDEQNRIGIFGSQYSPALGESKVRYVEFGTETDSVFTALLGEWSNVDPDNYATSELYMAVERRATTDVSREYLANIRNAYVLLTNPPGNFMNYQLIQNLRMFMGVVGRGYAAFVASGLLTPDQYDQFMEAYRTTSLWSLDNYEQAQKALTAQVLNNATRRIPSLITFLGQGDLNLPKTSGLDQDGSSFSADELEPSGVFTPGSWLNDASIRGQVVLAVIGLKSTNPVVEGTCKTFLTPLVGPDDLSPQLYTMIPEGNVRNFIREKFNLTTMEYVKPLDKSQEANLPLQSAVNGIGGKNSLRFVPRFVKIWGQETPVYPEPNDSLETVGNLPQFSYAYTVGEEGLWFAIQWGASGTAFVKKSQVQVSD